MVVPPKHPKMIILVGKPMVFGYHHFRKPPFWVSMAFAWFNLTQKFFAKSPVGFSVQLPLMKKPCLVNCLKLRLDLWWYPLRSLEHVSFNTSWWLNHVHSNLKPIIRLVSHKFVNGGVGNTSPTHCLLDVWSPCHNGPLLAPAPV